MLFGNEPDEGNNEDRFLFVVTPLNQEVDETNALEQNYDQWRGRIYKIQQHIDQGKRETNTKIDSLNSKIDTKVDSLNSKFDTQKAEMSQMSNKIDTQKAEMSQINTKIDSMKGEMNHKIDNMNTKMDKILQALGKNQNN